MRRSLLLIAPVFLSLPVFAAPPAAPAGKAATGKAPAAPAPIRAAPQTPAEKAAAALITPVGIGAHIRFLADDVLEGRAPGSRGADIAARYIASVMEASGLEPGGEYATFFQKVPLVGIKPDIPKVVTIKAGSKKVEIKTPSELVVMAGRQEDEAQIADAPLIFIGYGIVAPEFAWDDYKDVDVTGKIVVVMNNDPESDPALFAGKTRLWYGRWDYKYEQAARKGAAGAIVIHTTPSAGYPWQVVESSNTGERFELPAVPGERRLEARMWITEEAARKVAALGGQDLDGLRAAAETREFRPVPFGGRLSLAFKNKMRKAESANVLGLVRGTDPKLRDEVVVYTAHYDHLGIRAPKNGDAIYNGAVDNASGVAGLLSMARAAAAAPRLKRSLLFMAVTAEEQGLLGSKHYCRRPTFPAGRIAANLNLDSMNKSGKTKDVGFIGHGKSSLDAVVEAVAKTQGRTVHGDPYPEKGSFYRSDQFNFARLGVPSLYGRGGPTYVGRPADWGKEQADIFEKLHYHQPSDEYDDTWDLGGAVEDAQLYLLVGLRVANDPKSPVWKAGDEFEAARKEALEALGTAAPAAPAKGGAPAKAAAKPTKPGAP